MIWLNLFAHFFVLAGLGFLALCVIGIFTPPADYSSATADSGDAWDEGDAWDRGHDRWVDEQNEVA